MFSCNAGATINATFVGKSLPTGDFFDPNNAAATANALKAGLTTHFAATANRYGADSINVISAPVATDLPSCQTLLASAAFALNGHTSRSGGGQTVKIIPS